MDALILTCGTGGGHNSACAALSEELKSRGVAVETLNPYLLKGPKLADAVNTAYLVLAQKAPSAFGMVYQLGNAYRNLPVRSPVYHVNRLMAPLLEQRLRERPVDVIASTHLFPAEILSHLKSSAPPRFFIATDYTCVPFTEETCCDYYVIPAKELTEEFVSCGIPREKLLPLGIPVRKAFSGHLSREQAREQLGFTENKLVILLAGGSIGAGQIKQIIPLLLDHYGDRAHLTVICGNNRSLYRTIARKYGDRCEVIAFTPQMPVYMRACDLFLSKPGGLSSTEAAVSNTPLVHISPIPGCESRNIRFFSSNGMSYAAPSANRQLLEACDRLLEPEARRRMAENQKKIIPPHAAEKIAERMIEEATARAV